MRTTDERDGSAAQDRARAPGRADAETRGAARGDSPPFPTPSSKGSDRTWGPSAALRLQRLVGNRAVSEAVRMHGTGAATVQRRRIPTAASTAPLLAVAATDRAAHIEGLERVNARSLAALTPAQRTAVMAAARAAAGGAAAFAGAARAVRATVLADTLRTMHPTLVLGDPALINTGPRPGTADAANIATLVTNATALIGLVTAAGATSHLRDVFGAANVGTARARYAAAAARLATLHATGQIVTDRSGYNAEVGLGGLTNSARMALSPGTIDTPGTDPATVLVLHESMHAGNATVKDYGYLGTPGFTTLPDAVKLDNAAHYEVPARRMLPGMGHAYAGQVFVPAGTSVTVGGVTHTAPALTPIEQASRDASEVTRAAWNMGLNMHSLWVRLHLRRADWTGVDLPTVYGATAPHFSDCMPYWSKVQGLTVHQRPGIHATAGGPSTAPVTSTDVALSEGLVRLVARAKDTAKAQLGSSATATAFLAAHATGAERAAATTAATLQDLLLLCVCRAVGQMTGTPLRDRRVLREMAANPTYPAMLTTRSPAAFP